MRGCEQHSQKDVSFFSPTPSSVSLRMVLALAHQKKYEIRCGDISAAFLHAEISERVIVRQPKEWKGASGRLLGFCSAHSSAFAAP